MTEDKARRGSVLGRVPLRLGGARSGGIARFVLLRIAAGVLLLLTISFFLFAGTELLPGDPAKLAAGPHAPPEAVAALRERLGLEEPFFQRYAQWLGNFATGDLGRSVVNQVPVTELIGNRIKNTAILAGITLAIFVPCSILLGVWTAVRAGSQVDRILMFGSLGFVALPEFVNGALLILVFATLLQWLPSVSLVPEGGSPLTDLAILVLPVLTLLSVCLAWGVRLVRASMIDIAESPYVEQARLNGVPERRVIFRHMLPNALSPAVQAIAATAVYLFGGTVIVETIFAYPGIGEQLAVAVRSQDFALVQSVGMLLATATVVIYVIADLTVLLLVPRLRTAR